MKGIFGGMFDFDGDGELNLVEQAAEYDFIDRIVNGDQKNSWNSDDDEDEDDE